jgi:NAD(P)-dependent dehydrogenase (short-subunit alcohol dehydrogenase family)
MDGSQRDIGLRVAIITGVSRGFGRSLPDLAAAAIEG